MENIRKRIDVVLTNDDDKRLKPQSKPTFVSHKDFGNGLAALHMIKSCLKMNKPIYVGMCILDLSKTLMYDFHYNFIKKKFKTANLMFTDTDSLTYEIVGDDFSHVVFENYIREDGFPDWFDISETKIAYKEQIDFNRNKKVRGKMKDEANGEIIKEIVCLRSKMYSYIKESGGGDKKAKGINKCTTKNDIRHIDNVNVLQRDTYQRNTVNTIRSKSHSIGTYAINKVSLSSYDDKRYLLDGGIESLVYGHKFIISK